MALVFKAFSINLVEVLGTGRSCSKPPICRDDFQSADWGVVSGSTSQDVYDRLTCEFRGRNGFGTEFLERLLLLRRRGSIDAGVVGHAEIRNEMLEMLTGIFTGAGSDLRR